MPKLKTALITGISGQDGRLLAHFLLSKDYRVIGVTRSLANSSQILHDALIKGVYLEEVDYKIQGSIEEIITRYSPDEIYNLAGFTSGMAMFEQPIDMSMANGILVTRILDCININKLATKFCQASSREIFGNPNSSPQNELTIMKPRSPYGAAKLYADNMVRIYRETYGIFACSAILFNHESPHRTGDFLSKKICETAARIKLGLETELYIGNLYATRDWGFANDFVWAMWLMLQAAIPDDFVIASEESNTVEKFCDLAFAYLGLDYRNYVKTDPLFYRPSESAIICGNASKIKNTLGWKPRLNFEQLVHLLVDSELEKIQRDELD